MKSFVTAVVVANGNVDELATTLQRLREQSRSADRILIVETSGSKKQSVPAQTETRPLDNIELEVLRCGPVKNLAQALSQASEHFGGSFAGSPNEAESSWLWLLHDDSAPEQDTL